MMTTTRRWALNTRLARSFQHLRTLCLLLAGSKIVAAQYCNRLQSLA